VRRAPVGLLLALLVATPAAGCGGGGDKRKRELPPAPATLRLASPAFHDGATIPKRFTCSGENVSPPLAILDVPKRTRELALVMEDRDAGGFVHWTVLRIAPDTALIGEGRVPRGAVETKNSFGDRRWGGPCPPKSNTPHHYVFALYALEAPLGLGGGASADEVRKALAGHALARGTLTGRFGR
jgi:Raf kinase inhibitor-like YbhB/YbcL family protein